LLELPKTKGGVFVDSKSATVWFVAKIRKWRFILDLQGLRKPTLGIKNGMLQVAVLKKTILVVDDDKSILRTFTRILQKSGYEIETAETGKEAIEKAEKSHYDLALVDIRLPDMDGTDLLAKLKKQLQHTVKIMITGFPSLETGVKALDEGADAYLVKPVKPQELLVLLEEKLKNREEPAELSH
jgi:DNA-binding NtrC family response regulator